MKQAPGGAGDPIPAVLLGATPQPDSLAGICMKQAPGRAGNPIPAVLPGATPQSPCLCFAEGPPPTPIRSIFWLCQKRPILNGKFPRKLHQSWAMLKGVIHN